MLPGCLLMATTGGYRKADRCSSAAMHSLIGLGYNDRNLDLVHITNRINDMTVKSRYNLSLTELYLSAEFFYSKHKKYVITCNIVVRYTVCIGNMASVSDCLSVCHSYACAWAETSKILTFAL